MLSLDFYRLRYDPIIVMYVVILLAYGCPVQAIAKAFGLDERTEADWHERADKHCQGVHEHLLNRASKTYSRFRPMTLAPHASAP
jgi:hypothetical protein